MQRFRSEALELNYKTTAGKVGNELLYHMDEPIEVDQFSDTCSRCCKRYSQLMRRTNTPGRVGPYRHLNNRRPTID